MRALIVADLHYSLPQLDWLLARGHAYDLVIIAGDLLDMAGHVDIDTQIVVVGKYLGRLVARVPVIVCSGNHDLDAVDAGGERHAAWLQDLPEDGVQVDGAHLPLAGAIVSICRYWDGPSGRAALDAFLDSAPLAPGQPWIWVHHLPPDDAKVSWNGHLHDGDSHLNSLIATLSPHLVLSGHVHAAPFRAGGSWNDRIGTTWLLNPGRQLGGLPSFIELDLSAEQARWTSLAGNGHLRLQPEVTSPMQETMPIPQA